MSSEWFMTVWPWIGLGAAAVLLILLFATRWLQADPGRSRWRDITWIAWLAAAAYMLHNVEEYGLDLAGAALGFPTAMQTMLGKTPPDAFFIAVNLSLVWVAGPLLAGLSRRHPSVGVSLPAFALANAITHAAPALAQGAYNSGLLTAAVLFLPISIWTLVGVCGNGGPRRSAFWAAFGISLLSHAALIGTAILFGRGVIPASAMAPVMLVANVVAVVLWYWAGTWADRRQLVGRPTGGAAAA